MRVVLCCISDVASWLDSTEGVCEVRSDKLRYRFSVGLGWLNFMLVTAGIIKFIPLMLWWLESELTCSLGGLGFASNAEFKVWAYDLVSDTHLIILVWLSIGAANQWLFGQNRWLPWRN